MEIILSNLLRMILEELNLIYPDVCIYVYYDGYEDFKDGVIRLYLVINVYSEIDHYSIDFSYDDFKDLNILHRKIYQYLSNLYETTME